MLTLLSRMFLAVGFIAAGWANAQAINPSPLNSARDEWHLCIAKAATQLDDGMSPASDIAIALQSNCEAQFDAMLDRMTLSQEMRYEFAKKRLEQTKEVATIIVLKLRAQKRATAERPK